MNRMTESLLNKVRNLEGNHLSQHPPWLVNNIDFCYGGELQTKTDIEKKHFLQLMEKHANKEVYMNDSKNKRKMER